MKGLELFEASPKRYISVEVTKRFLLRTSDGATWGVTNEVYLFSFLLLVVGFPCLVSNVKFQEELADEVQDEEEEEEEQEEEGKTETEEKEEEKKEKPTTVDEDEEDEEV